MENKKIFCPYPYNHLSIGQSGNLRACCVANLFESKKNVWDIDNLYSWWKHDKEYNNLRNDFSQGIRNKICKECWNQEDQKVTSLRQKVENDRYPVDKNNPTICNVEFTGGRLCNLACRMCDGSNSSLVYKEKRPWDFTANFDLKLNWLDDPIEQKKVLDLLLTPTIEKIYFTGGEPQIITSYQTILEDLSLKRDLSNVLVHFNTNCTVYNNSFWESIKKFGRRQLDLSIDGVGDAYELIRYGSDWSKTKTSLFKILDSIHKAETGHTSIYLTIVKQLGNVDQALDLQSLFNDMIVEQRNNVENHIMMIPVTHFQEWQWQNLPLEILEKEYELLAHATGEVIDQYKNDISSAINFNNFNSELAKKAVKKEEYFKNQFGKCLWDRRPDWFEIYSTYANS